MPPVRDTDSAPPSFHPSLSNSLPSPWLTLPCPANSSRAAQPSYEHSENTSQDTPNSAPSPKHHCGPSPRPWAPLAPAYFWSLVSNEVPKGDSRLGAGSAQLPACGAAHQCCPQHPQIPSDMHMAALTLSRSREGLGDGQTARSGLCVVTHPTPLLILWIFTHQLSLTWLQAGKVKPGPSHYTHYSLSDIIPALPRRKPSPSHPARALMSPPRANTRLCCQHKTIIRSYFPPQITEHIRSRWKRQEHQDLLTLTMLPAERNGLLVHSLGRFYLKLRALKVLMFQLKFNKSIFNWK